MVFSKKNINNALEWLNEIDRLNGIIKSNSIHNNHSNEYIGYLKKYVKKLKIGFDMKFNGLISKNAKYAMVHNNTRFINESIECIDLLLLLLETHFLRTDSKDDVWKIDKQVMELSKRLHDYLKENDAKPIYMVDYPFKNSKWLDYINNIICGYWNTNHVYEIEKILFRFLMEYGDSATFASAEILSEYYKIDLIKH